MNYDSRLTSFKGKLRANDSIWNHRKLSTSTGFHAAGQKPKKERGRTEALVLQVDMELAFFDVPTALLARTFLCH